MNEYTERRLNETLEQLNGARILGGLVNAERLYFRLKEILEEDIDEQD